jgi:outer membrane protein OmpA-like peptidoglycan-associated protein
MAKPHRPKEDVIPVPTWILSFSDMITNMLAFFVLLQCFSHTKDAGLFAVGQGSYKQAIAGFGIPGWLFGYRDDARRDYVEHDYPMEESPVEQPQGRVIDADNEKIRNMFADLKKELDTTAVDVPEELIRVEVTPIGFERSQAALNDQAKAYLRQLAFDLKQTVRVPSARFYVIGLAAEEADAKRQSCVSARRAGAVEKALDESLRAAGAPAEWSVRSWGAGAGDEWCRKHGCVRGKTSILIAIMKEKAPNG